MADHATPARRTRRMALAAAVAALALAFAAPAVALVGPTSSPQPALAYGGDFPDPFILTTGGQYFAYSTNVAGVNVPVMTSPDLANWTPRTEALPHLPAWASAGRTWAPAVLASGTRYVLYYTVMQTSSGRQCLSVATASSPLGPFVDSSRGPLACQLQLGGSIDPYAFTDPATGNRYLLWKSDNNALGQATSLWGQRLNAAGTALAWRSSPVRLLTESPLSWEAPAIEGPAMVLSGSTYFLFYGANHWDQATSGIGYATCSGPLGPCTDRSTAGPWMGNTAGVPPIGPQGPTVFTDASGGTRLGLSGWNGPVGYPNGGVRALWTASLTFSNGVPSLG